MKKLLLLVPLLFTGCGVEMIKKQNLLDGLDKAKTQVDQARAEACSDSVTAQITAAYASLEALIQTYSK